MRIGIVAYDLSTMRGGTKLALTLGHELKKTGHHIAYCCAKEKINYLQQKFGENYDFGVYKQRFFFLPNCLVNLTSLWNLGFAARRLCKEFKPDVVIEVGGVISSLFVPILAGIPTIYYCIFPTSVYGLLSIKKRTCLELFYLRLARIFEGVFFRKVSRIIAMSSFVKAVLKKEFNVNSDIISPPINTDQFVPGTKKNTVLFVGRYDRAYKLDILISKFKKRIKNAKLMLIGQLDATNRNHFDELKKAESSDIKLCANIDFGLLLKLYAEAKVFLYPGWSSYGLTLAEAQSAGTPAICFGKGKGSAEIVLDNETGYVLDDNDFDGALEKIDLLLKDKKLWKKFSCAARKNALERLGLPTFAEKFSKVIEDVSEHRLCRAPFK